MVSSWRLPAPTSAFCWMTFPLPGPSPLDCPDGSLVMAPRAVWVAESGRRARGGIFGQRGRTAQWVRRQVHFGLGCRIVARTGALHGSYRARHRPLLVIRHTGSADSFRRWRSIDSYLVAGHGG